MKRPGRALGDEFVHDDAVSRHFDQIVEPLLGVVQGDGDRRPSSRALRAAAKMAMSMYATPITWAIRPTHAVGLRGEVCSMTAARPIAMSSRPRLYQYENDVRHPPAVPDQQGCGEERT